MHSQNNSNQGPIFIGGLERSGKTYMRMMLASHPNLAISRRTNMWTFYYGRFGPLTHPQNLERCLTAMMQRKLIRELEPDLDRIRDEFRQGVQSYGRLFELFHSHYAERVGKKRWGDQSGLLERQAAHIFAAHPTAKMIQMIRDPRDRFQALCERHPRNRQKLGQETAKWRYSETFARQNQQAFSGQVMVVRYESMVSQPEKIMRDVCHFLGEDFYPAMLSLPNEQRFAPVAAGQSPLTTTFIGRFRSDLSKHETRFIQQFTKNQMPTYGYEQEPIEMTASEKLHFNLRMWAPNVAQMIGWRVFHTAHIRYEKKAGGNSKIAQQVATAVTN